MVYIKKQTLLNGSKFTKLNAMACGCRVTPKLTFKAKRNERQSPTSNKSMIMLISPSSQCPKCQYEHYFRLAKDGKRKFLRLLRRKPK